MPFSAPSPINAAQLLAAWEAAATPAQRAAQAPYQPTVLAWLAEFTALFTGNPKPGHLDIADAQAVIAGASSLRVAVAAATGSGRIGVVLAQLLAALPAQPPPYCALLGVTNPADLQMDELVELTDALHATLLHPDGYLTFGLSKPAFQELRVWLLVAYAS